VAFGTVWGWFVGLVWGRLVGLFVGLATVPVVGAVFGAKDQIRIVEERLTWSWKKARRGALGGLVIGVPVGLLFGVMFGLLGGLAFELLVGLLFGLFGGLGIMLFIGLLFVLIGGIDSPAVDIPSTPNQGIRNSLQSGLFALLFFGPIFWLVHVPAAGALFGLFGGLVFGLKAVIQHSVLRYILFRSGVAPLNYAEFLDYTSSRHLTRRVGGGFIFRHRLLMEHFAHGRGGDVWKAKRQLALPSATTAHPTHTGTTRRTRTEASS
jgi:hypothetical protein